MFNYIRDLFSDPRGTLIFFLLAFPGRILAISAHEFAHAWVADRCGDPTARMLGRLTLNPMKHLDLIGTLMMLFLGFGWAKPVPVNPRNYRNFRRDDLLVSVAGVTMNFVLFLLGYLLSALMMLLVLGKLGRGWGDISQLLVRNAASMNPELVAQTLGRLPSYIYQMLQYFVYCNIVLTIFNLLPVPPLDGYHLLNDLLLKKSLFASGKVARYATLALFALMLTGLLGRGLSFVSQLALDGAGAATSGLFGLLGLI